MKILYWLLSLVLAYLFGVMIGKTACRIDKVEDMNAKTQRLTIRTDSVFALCDSIALHSELLQNELKDAYVIIKHYEHILDSIHHIKPH